MTEPLARAGFRRGLRPGAIADFLGDVLLRSGVGLPVPGRREPDQDVRTGLPERFVLEVGAGTVRVLDEAGAGELESWPRGEVDAWVHSLDEFETELDLIWPDGERMGRIEAEGSPEAHAVAELLAADTRARRGADRRAEETLRRLVGEVLPEEVRRDRHAALAEQATLLGPGERPRIVAEGSRGFSPGIVLLSDRALRWCSGGRRRPLVLPREAIASAAVEQGTDLVVEAAGRRLKLERIEPAGAGAAFAAALTRGPRHSLDRLREEDAVPAGARLDRLKELMEEDEQAQQFAMAHRGLTRGALVVTDRRVLWVAKRGEPLVLNRTLIQSAEVLAGRFSTDLDLRLEGDRLERFEAIEPKERAAPIAAVLAP